jgi:hypothetical protein
MKLQPRRWYQQLNGIQKTLVLIYCAALMHFILYKTTYYAYTWSGWQYGSWNWQVQSIDKNYMELYGGFIPSIVRYLFYLFYSLMALRLLLLLTASKDTKSSPVQP